MATHAMQPMQCNPCNATHAMQPMQCNQCNAAHAMQHTCNAVYMQSRQPMHCNTCSATHALQVANAVSKPVLIIGFV